MKRWVFALFMIFAPIWVWSMEGPNHDLGQTLFNSNALGDTDRSCATCHPNGKGLEKIDDFDNSMLKDIVNACIRDALKGKMIDPESTEMNSIILYLRSLN